MPINQIINTITLYIEENLTKDIDILDLAKLVGINEFILKQLFSIVCNISISGYIRNRRLSKSVFDILEDEKIIDVALKYRYESSTSFARAFKRFHGIKPSQVKKLTNEVKNYPIIHLDVSDINKEFVYKIVSVEDKVLYGKCIKSDEVNIDKDAPKFWQYMDKKYHDKYGSIDYGAVVTTDVKDMEYYEYWILYDKKIEEFDKFSIPSSKYLVFRIERDEAEDIQNMCYEVFNKFLPSTDYTFKMLPELEHYHDHVVDYYVPII